MTGDARLDAEMADNDRLRDRIALLEAALGFNFSAPIEWRLTGAEARVFGVILAREVATKEGIMAALYSDRGMETDVDIKIVDVHVCKLRKKLKAFGVAIETVWGLGYRMTAKAKDAYRHEWETPADAVAA